MRKRNLLVPLIALCIVAVLAAAMLLTYQYFKPKTSQGSKEITVAVVIPDEKTKEFTLKTDAEYLSQALEEKALIKGEQSAYGLFISEVNGRTADSSKQEWWCITKDGANVDTGADMTPISDGEHYEITLKTGY
jgi:Na+-translocating ferredoxin:NAD+ oxidoreductase RnfG subunit